MTRELTAREKAFFIQKGIEQQARTQLVEQAREWLTDITLIEDAMDAEDFIAEILEGTPYELVNGLDYRSVEEGDNG